MEQSSHPLPKKHVFVCTNHRDGACCSGTGSEEVFKELKAWSRARLHLVWVTRTGCLGFCNDVGATIVIYPEGILLEKVEPEDIELIKKIILE